jgi:hypothetical protein
MNSELVLNTPLENDALERDLSTQHHLLLQLLVDHIK